MVIHKFVEKMKVIQENLLKFIENVYQEEENYQNFVNCIKNIRTNKHEIKILLYIINKISNNHCPYPNFFSKIEQILNLFQREIQQYFSNWEIFCIFNENKRVLLYLFEEKLITIDDIIFQEIMSKAKKRMNYPEYFAPEIKQYDIEIYQKLKNKDDNYPAILDENLDSFNEKRKKGANDHEICKIIQEDLIEDFIIYVNKKDYSLKSTIKNSIFETNQFLLNQEQLTLIKYATFYGSSQIFKYLYKNGVDFTPSLWLCVVHSKSEEIIQILEENKVDMDSHLNNQNFDYLNDELYEYILIESIYCHHNDVYNYIEQRFQNDCDVSKYGIFNYNFIYFPKDIDDKELFLYSCIYDYFIIVEHLLSTKDIDIKFHNVFLFKIYKKISFTKLNRIQNFIFFNKSYIEIAADYNNEEILTFLLSRIGNKIDYDCFTSCKNVKKITIPSSISIIDDNTFNNCTSLIKIDIPELMSFGRNVFTNCSSLVSIEIPSFVSDIEISAFEDCSSLKTIKIPSSVSSIGKNAFKKCKSLKNIEIPSSVSSIGDCAFFGCSSLVIIDITSPVTPNVNKVIERNKFSPLLTSFGKNVLTHCSSLVSVEIPPIVSDIELSAFEGCSSLVTVKIPSSVLSIGKNAFRDCKSLKNIKIPASVTSICDGAFFGCSSLVTIEIPSSVTSIGGYAFRQCSSLVVIEIPRSVTSIKNCVFCQCSSLKSIKIPPSITSIGNWAFEKCFSLTNVEIPPSVTLIGKNAFKDCTSLKSIEIKSSVYLKDAGIGSNVEVRRI